VDPAAQLLRALARSCACLALLCAPIACSDSTRAGAGHAVAQPAPNPEYHEVLPPEGAGVPQPPDHPTAEDIARASATDLARAPNDVDWSGGDAAHGQALFASQCALCHGGGGKGDGVASPAINPKPRDFTDGRFYIDANANNRTGEDVDLARVILHGPRAFGGTPAMPAFEGAVSEADVRDLIAHIRTLAHDKVANSPGASSAGARPNP
jgi:mono/diheme cytochrome c family protein